MWIIILLLLICIPAFRSFVGWLILVVVILIIAGNLVNIEVTTTSNDNGGLQNEEQI
jgi:hypothetical protein